MKDDLNLKLNKFTSLYDLQKAFPTEKACIKHLEQLRNGKPIGTMNFHLLHLVQ